VEVRRASQTQYAAPCRAAPQGTGPQCHDREHRAGGRQGLRHHGRQAGVPDQGGGAPARHDQVEEHGHPGRGHVDEDDPVGLALLVVGGRDDEAQVQTDQREQSRGPREPGNEPAGQRVEGSGRCKLEPGGRSRHDHSYAILTARAVAKGPKTQQTISPAPSSDRWAPASRPTATASAAPAPKMRMGTASGKHEQCKQRAAGARAQCERGADRAEPRQGWVCRAARPATSGDRWLRATHAELHARQRGEQHQRQTVGHPVRKHLASHDGRQSGRVPARAARACRRHGRRQKGAAATAGTPAVLRPRRCRAQSAPAAWVRG
jgi:hypothetical protein